jgi:hypothetical protein
VRALLSSSRSLSAPAGQKNGNGSGLLAGIGINALSALAPAPWTLLTAPPDDATILGYSSGSNNQGTSNGANSGNKVVVVDGGKKSTQSSSTGGTKIQDNSQRVREIPPLHRIA